MCSEHATQRWTSEFPAHQLAGIGDYHRHYHGTNAENELQDSGSVTLSKTGGHTHLLGTKHGGGDLRTEPVAITVNWIIKTKSVM
ncbi:MAG: hypothetical protein ABW148_17670 [Sedimenticola sp.]